MSQRRKRIVGVQVAAVALLVVLVYLTLLRPEGSSPLRVIEAPGGGPEVTLRPEGPPGPARPGQRGPSNRQGGNRQGGNRQGGGHGLPGESGSSGSEIAATVGLTAGTGGEPPASFKGTTPGDDQYKDAVTALLDKVAGGGAIDE